MVMVLSKTPLVTDNRLLKHNEKRKSPRRICNWIAGVDFPKKSLSVRVLNISESGALFLMPSLVKDKERAYIKIYAMINGNKKTIDAVVEFRHHTLSNNQFHCGAEFIKISDKNKIALRSYVRGVSLSSAKAALERAIETENSHVDIYVEATEKQSETEESLNERK